MSVGAFPPPGGPPPPGWYPDPAPPGGGLRWWDGAGWTEYVAPGGSSVGGSSLGGSAAGDSSVGGSSAGGPAPELPARPTIPVRAVWYAAVGLVVGELIGGILGSIAELFTGQGNSPAVILLGEIGLWLGMLGACVYVSRRYGTSSLARDFTLGIRWADIGPGVLVAVVGTVLSAIASTAFSGTRFAGTNTQIITGQRHNSAGIAVVTVIVALGAPFFEELFFRGLIRTALVGRLGPTGAVIGQGLLFGAAHFDPSNGLGNVSIIVTIAALGMVLGYTANRTGRLGAGMIGHGLFNLVAAILVITS